jgi:Ca2+:H+ antiporter
MALDAAIVGVTAEWLVSSIDGLVETHPSLSREWVGLILLPIVSRLKNVILPSRIKLITV